METRSLKEEVDRHRAVQVSEHVYWVGAVDWGIRDFHGYSTHRGTTYNCYLVLGDRIALVDTVKAQFVSEMLARITSVVSPENVNCLVANHAEMDHSGGLPEMIAALHPEMVYASRNGVSALRDHFHLEQEITAVRDLETLDLGHTTLTFAEMRMLHWPDSMATYVAEDRTLLSNDAFGMHLASGERFADELPEWVLDYEARKYYANILMPLSPLIAKALERVSRLGLAIDTIAPSHGPIWREPSEIVSRYGNWSAGGKAKKAIIVYDTMWGSTAKMGAHIAEGLIERDVAVKVMPLKSCHRSDVALELLDTAALVVGSPTLNNNVFPTVADTLTYLKGLKPQGLVGSVFGSYGWSGEAANHVAEDLRRMKVELVTDPLTVRYVPNGEALQQCVALGHQVARAITAGE